MVDTLTDTDKHAQKPSLFLSKGQEPQKFLALPNHHIMEPVFVEPSKREVGKCGPPLGRFGVTGAQKEFVCQLNASLTESC